MLRNFEVIAKLKEEYGISIRSSQQLNKILEGLGIIERLGTDWLPTDFGMKYYPYRSKTLRPNEWLEPIVSFIAKHYEGGSN